MLILSNIALPCWEKAKHNLSDCMVMVHFESITDNFVKFQVDDFIKRYCTDKRDKATALRTVLKLKECKARQITKKYE